MRKYQDEIKGKEEDHQKLKDYIKNKKEQMTKLSEDLNTLCDKVSDA